MSRVRSSGDAPGTRAARLASSILSSLSALVLLFGNAPSRAGAATPSPENNPFAPTVVQVEARFGRIQQEVDRLRADGQPADADRLAAALQHFRDQLAGTAPSQALGPELDVVSIHDPRNARVNVGPTERPVVLALASYEETPCRLDLQPGANLQKVIVYRPGPPSRPIGLPENTRSRLRASDSTRPAETSSMDSPQPPTCSTN